LLKRWKSSDKSCCNEVVDQLRIDDLARLLERRQPVQSLAA
jgi:hypothetical protein